MLDSKKTNIPAGPRNGEKVTAGPSASRAERPCLAERSPVGRRASVRRLAPDRSPTDNAPPGSLKALAYRGTNVLHRLRGRHLAPRNSRRAHELQQVLPAHPEGGVVRTGEHAARVLGRRYDISAQVAGRRLVRLDRRPDLDRVHVDVAVRAVARAQAAADAMVFDHDLERQVGVVARPTVNRIDRAADQAIRIKTRPTRTGDEKLIEPESLAD
jgi:hypothetical protein